MFARVWAEMAEFDGLDVEMMIADEGAAIDPDGGRGCWGPASIKRCSWSRPTPPRRPATTWRCDGAGRRRPSGAVDGRLHRLDGMRAVRDGRVGCRRHARRLPEGTDDAARARVRVGRAARSPPTRRRTCARYWDWTFRLQEGPQYLRFCGTAPVSHIFGFREALRMIEEEGLEARWQRHAAGVGGARRGRRVSAGRAVAVRPRSPHRGDSVTTIATGRVDAAPVGDRPRPRRSSLGRAARSRRPRLQDRPHGARQRGVHLGRAGRRREQHSSRSMRRSAARVSPPRRRRSRATSDRSARFGLGDAGRGLLACSATPASTASIPTMSSADGCWSSDPSHDEGGDRQQCEQHRETPHRYPAQDVLVDAVADRVREHAGQAAQDQAASPTTTPARSSARRPA